MISLIQMHHHFFVLLAQTIHNFLSPQISCGWNEPSVSQSPLSLASLRLHFTTLLVPSWDMVYPASSGALGSPSIYCIQTHNLAFWRRFGGSLLARISSRSKWLKIWSVLACSSFSNTWIIRKGNNKKVRDKQTKDDLLSIITGRQTLHHISLLDLFQIFR